MFSMNLLAGASAGRRAGEKPQGREAATAVREAATPGLVFCRLHGLFRRPDDPQNARPRRAACDPGVLSESLRQSCLLQNRICRVS